MLHHGRRHRRRDRPGALWSMEPAPATPPPPPPLTVQKCFTKAEVLALLSADKFKVPVFLASALWVVGKLATCS